MMDLLHDSAVWVLLSFVVFILATFKVASRGVAAKLDGRIAEIKREIETAESLRIEAQELLAQYQRKQRDAAREAEMIVVNARKHAEEIKKQAETELRETLNRREKNLEDRLRRMEETAIQEIQSYAAQLAVKATAEIIASKMDEQANAKLVDESIRQVGESLN